MEVEVGHMVHHGHRPDASGIPMLRRGSAPVRLLRLRNELYVAYISSGRLAREPVEEILAVSISRARMGPG
jgi:hypothetical protein